MEVIANLWWLWMIGILATAIWSVCVTWGMWRSIACDERKIFDASIVKKNLNLLLSYVLFTLFVIMLIIAIISLVVLAIVD